MSVLTKGSSVRTTSLGLKVDKSLSPTNATVPVFNVIGGKVLITSIVGEVTTVMTGTATSLSLSHDPTDGAAGALCAATVVTSDEKGTLYGISGVAAEVMSAQAAGGTEVPLAAFARQGRGLILNAGVLSQVGTAANTGVVKWTVTYVPLDDGASVEAA